MGKETEAKRAKPVTIHLWNIRNRIPQIEQGQWGIQ